MIRKVCAGIGVSYETVSKDYGNTTYSSARAARLDEIDNWKVLQHWLIEHFHQRISREWMDMAVLAGVFNFSDYEANPKKYAAMHWTPRGWALIDPAKELPAQRMSVRAGLATLTGLLEQQGINPAEHFQKRRRELDECGELELIFDTDAAQVTDRGQQVVSEDPLATPGKVPNDEHNDALGGNSDEEGAAGEGKKSVSLAQVLWALRSMGIEVHNTSNGRAGPPAVH